MTSTGLFTAKDGNSRNSKGLIEKDWAGPLSSVEQVVGGATWVGVMGCQASKVGHTNVFGPHSIRASQLRNKLFCIQPHFDDIVEEGKHWCQWKGGHKQGDKTKLNDYERAHGRGVSRKLWEWKPTLLCGA